MEGFGHRRRLARLNQRKRNVLCLWYMTSLPTEVDKRVGASRVHCYRLRNQALAEVARGAELPEVGAGTSRQAG